jgi:hypothetical protein
MIRRAVCFVLGHAPDVLHEDKLGAAWRTCPRCGAVTASASLHGGKPWERERQKRIIGPDGWTCMCCSDYRPDAFISVLSRHRVYANVVVVENIRYCNDREFCKARAHTLARRCARNSMSGQCDQGATRQVTLADDTVTWMCERHAAEVEAGHGIH